MLNNKLRQSENNVVEFRMFEMYGRRRQLEEREAVR